MQIRSTTTKKGFTLIELLVVIAIIGILASIILASLNTARAKGRDAKRISDIKQIQLALELYFDANGSYPANIYSGSPSPLVAGGYISSMPYDPSSATACLADGNTGQGCYSYVGLCAGGNLCTPTSYHLGATLETSNSALANDADSCQNTSGNSQTGTICSSGQGVHDAPASTNSNIGDFAGLSAAAGGSPCGGTAGTPAPGGTETCYDVTP